MSNEEKATLEAETEVETEVVETEEKDEQSVESEKSETEDSKQLEADLKREREARERAEKALAENRYKRAEQKRKVEVETEVVEDEEDKPLTTRQFQELLAKEREATRKEMQSAEAERFASELSNTDGERQGLLDIYHNRSFPAHLSLKEQFEECYVILNKKKILGENSELKRALASKGNVSKDTSTFHDAPVGSTPALDAEMTGLGYRLNQRTKNLEKKLPDGRTLILNTKTNKTSISA